MKKRRKAKRQRDIEKVLSTAKFVKKLRRLATVLAKKERFQIQVHGERITVPAKADFSIAHERGDGVEEVEFQISWKYE